MVLEWNLPHVLIPLTFLYPVPDASAVMLRLNLRPMLMPLTTMEVTMAAAMDTLMVTDMVWPTTPGLPHTLGPLLHPPSEAHKVSVDTTGANKCQQNQPQS